MLANCQRKRKKFNRMAEEQTTNAEVSQVYEALQGAGRGTNLDALWRLTVAGKKRHLKERAAWIKEVLNLRLPKKKK